MKFLRFLCVLALALCVTANVYAETQSVKVSGDLTMRGIYRNDYSMISQVEKSASIDGTDKSWAMTVAAVEVDADLTDNVTTVIRLLNQRDWNVASSVTSTTTTANEDEFDVMVDLAYVQLKNFIYSPLTLTIGRQNLWFGRGFIIGANQQNPGSATATDSTFVPGNLSAPEYTAINSFDAVKAVLDYDPWTITGVYAMIDEGSVSVRDNINLWGVNVGYKFNKMNGEAEGYWFYKTDRGTLIPNKDLKANSNDVYTIGARGSFDPISWVTLAGEGAWQGGQYIGNINQVNSRARSAFAMDFSGEVRYFTDKFAWKPKFGVEYIYYSGDPSSDNTPELAGGLYRGWDSMYRGKFDSAIREFVGKFYASTRYPVRTNYTQATADDSRTNQSQVIFLGSIQPMDSLTIKGNYNLFWNLEQYDQAVDKSQGFVGQEIDLQANWDYTEDVSFGLLAGWFIPGDVYYDGKSAVATDLVGSVKVSF
ncbi:MAG: alginate export family protein [Candidatus Omnitrophica bacterium]|nr:alginate export family protein [Candidatus Omnitrophota bacterium]